MKEITQITGSVPTIQPSDEWETHPICIEFESPGGPVSGALEVEKGIKQAKKERSQKRATVRRMSPVSMSDKECDAVIACVDAGDIAGGAALVQAKVQAVLSKRKPAPSNGCKTPPYEKRPITKGAFGKPKRRKP